MYADDVHQVRSKGTNYIPRSNGKFPTASPLGAFQHQTCHHCTHIKYVGAAFWVGDRCFARVEASSTCLEWLLNLTPWPNITPLFHHAAALEQAACYMARPL
jgi:hypothetical protein